MSSVVPKRAFKLDPLVSLAVLLLGVIALTFVFGSSGPERKRVELDRTPLSDGKRYKIPVSISQPARGASVSSVVVVEWCDVVGAACRESARIMDQVLAENPQVKHVFRHFPRGADSSMFTHEMARYAFEHAGKFWQARALLLTHDQDLTDAELPVFEEKLGLDAGAVKAALQRHSVAGYVTADVFFAGKFGIEEGPAIFVNGRRLLPPLSVERLNRLIDEETKSAQQLAATGIAADRLYQAIVKEALWDAKGTTASTARP